MQHIVKNLLWRRKVEEILSSLRNILMELHEVPDQFLDHNDKFCFQVLLAFILIYMYCLFLCESHESLQYIICRDFITMVLILISHIMPYVTVYDESFTIAGYPCQKYGALPGYSRH